MKSFTTGLLCFSLASQALSSRQDQPNPFKQMIDQEYSTALSRDHRYKARLAYNENAAMTFGYFHVDIIDSKHKGKPLEIAEVAAEGLTKIAWVGRRTLAIYYNPGEVPHDAWVVHKTKWHDVTIVYRKDGR